jgi:hypothetical protein
MPLKLRFLRNFIRFLNSNLTNLSTTFLMAYILSFKNILSAYILSFSEFCVIKLEFDKNDISFFH